MREIKFRGKVKFNGNHFFSGEWVEGSYRYDNVNDKHFIWVYEEDKYGNVTRNEEIEVDLETVGQYTGKTAQCIDEIFEGDNCEVTTFDHNGHDYQHKCVVKYIDGAFVFVNVEKEFYLPLYLVEDTDSDIEVIGNIHDNPNEV